MASLSDRFPALGDAHAVVLGSFARGITPPPRLTVTQWAETERYVSAESGSPYPGRWNGDRVPYLREVQDVLSLSHPCTEVASMKSAQVAFSEAGLNLVGSVIHGEPSPILILLPSLGEMDKYAKLKLGTTIDVTPALRDRVRPQRSRDADSSTQGMLRFAGGFAVIGHASSSQPLQMMSYRVVVLEEVSEYPWDVDGRGDPVDLAFARTKAWRETRGAKIFYCSTPGIDGACRITAKFEASDQRRYYVPCPHCGAYQLLRWENLKWESDTPPFNAHFVCLSAGCGGVIEHHHKTEMLARGVWLKCHPGSEDDLPPPKVFEPEDLARWRARGSAGREPGFAIWQAYSPFNSWDGIVKEFQDAKRKGPAGLKVFTQQTLGEPWKEKGDAPEAEKLLERRLSYPHRQLPPGALVVTGFCDVQADRLQWGVYACGQGLPGVPTFWRIDGGTIPGDPEGDEVWKRLEAVQSRRYPDARGATWPIEAFGVDTGYLSHRVYLWARRRQGVFACDGRGGDGRAQAWLLPPVGTPKKVDIDWRGQRVKGGCLLWPIGTWPLKSQHYAALRRMLRGPGPDGVIRPGALYVNEDADLGLLKQMTAETLRKGTRNGRPHQWWEQHGANEELDIAVGCRALAYYLGCDTMTSDQWQALAAHRAAAPVADRDLFNLPLVAAAEPPVVAPAAPSVSPSDEAPRAASVVLPAPLRRAMKGAGGPRITLPKATTADDPYLS
ncbi:phage terminase large subunit family protein [Azospirillum sp. A1-3]|uniref:phage terminase large subunit family protein n=1 Tax=Azospirillum sp. A1-3 TaxID=185874 RepID=UPI0020779436|nr:terminase gpA endonuclease subunit [Azospirillum sp. A1-3]MCM8738298.1 phage terminase large subunit family protein [Azospirillum sp. A1-3]